MKIRKKNMALFIDGENIGYKKAERIMEVASEKGYAYSLCTYARQKDKRTKRLHEKAKELGVKEKRLYGRPQRNLVDNKIKRDIEVMLNEDKVDVLIIASSDGGYRNIVSKAREKGKKVIVLGESKTPERLRKEASEFVEI